MKEKIGLKVHRPNRPVSQKIIPAILVVCFVLVAICGYGKNYFPNTLTSKDSNLPPALFPHEDHMAFLDCLDCHHDYKNGTNDLDEDELYEGNPDIQCATCHNGKTSFPALQAFHRQCIHCHDTQGQGPVVCGECHTKS
nr:cytochrome c3 family protein [uncultured Desulfobacter sp.]